MHCGLHGKNLHEQRNPYRVIRQAIALWTRKLHAKVEVGVNLIAAQPAAAIRGRRLDGFSSLLVVAACARLLRRIPPHAMYI